VNFDFLISPPWATRKSNVRCIRWGEAYEPKNLSLDASAIERGERYAHRHGTSLSALVNQYLGALPVDTPAVVRSPAVRRLYGAATRRRADKAGYDEHLARKYGGD
jgi:hypothetical protein